MLSDIYYQQRPLIFEPRAPFNKGSDTSKEAAQSISRKSLSDMCKKERSAICDAPDGLTCEEVEIKLALKHQTASARLKDLRDAGFVAWRLDPATGKHKTRQTSSGRKGTLYFFVHDMSAQA